MVTQKQKAEITRKLKERAKMERYLIVPESLLKDSNLLVIDIMESYKEPMYLMKNGVKVYGEQEIVEKLTDVIFEDFKNTHTHVVSHNFKDEKI